MMRIQTPRLSLVLQSMEDVRTMIAGFPPEVRAQLSPVWLEQVAAATEATPWVHGFSIVEQITGLTIGSAGFKGPPSADGLVEIAYQVHPDHQGQGYATEAAAALTVYAFSDDRVRTVCARPCRFPPSGM